MNEVAYTFQAGGIYNGLFVMADRETGSIWTHFDGTVLTGPLANGGLVMEIRPLTHTSWGSWLADHGDTTVLAPVERYKAWYGTSSWGDGNVGASWLGPLFSDTVINNDERLPGNELILGAGVGDDFRAYSLDIVEELTVIHDDLGGQPVVVFLDPVNVFGLAFSSVVDGEERRFFVEDGEVFDDEGTRWRLDGHATDGPDEGTSLEYVTSFVTEWYGWAAYHPETTIHGLS